MNSSRSRRFLIDRIDERLGDVEKEKKFDLIMVFIGLALIITGALVIAFSAIRTWAIIISLFLILLGLSLCYVMIKEYFDDCKKANACKL